MVFRSLECGRALLLSAACASAAIALAVPRAAARDEQAPAAQAPNAVRQVGTIKFISGNNIVLAMDTGSDVTIVVQDGARLIRVEPGQKDLKEAVAMHLQDLLPGDRILVRGQLGNDGKTVLATSVIAMKKADIAEKQAREREDWQRHGTAGLVSGVDTASNSILIVLPGAGEKKTAAIQLTKDTILRRYSPDSVKFDDAKPAPLDQIKPGDQIRARGMRSLDGSELTAVEVVSGTFRNISGRISAIDTSANSITLEDLATKKSVTLRITGDSQVRKLPLPMAQRIAARLKESAAEASGTGAAGNSASGPANASSAQEARPRGPGSGGVVRNGGGGGDFQQAISRVPVATLADLQKGDAVMIVATEGGPSSLPSVITLLGGVEPILQASPNGNAATILSPWSLGGEPSGDAGNP